jgi:hypothetical protein
MRRCVEEGKVAVNPRGGPRTEITCKRETDIDRRDASKVCGSADGSP